MCFTYDSWSDEFKLSEMKEAYNKFRELKIDFKKYTTNELIELGFSKWDEDLLLMPLWAYNICEDGIELTSISGDNAICGKDNIDTDVRYGCIAYGFLTKDLLKRDRKLKLEEIKKEAH